MNPFLSPSRSVRVASLLAAAIAIASVTPAQPSLIVSTWNGGNGNWSTPNGWTPIGVPNNVPSEINYVARVDANNPVRSRVNVDGNFNVLGLQLSSGDRLLIQPGFTLGITGLNSFENNGDIRIIMDPGRGGGRTRLAFAQNTQLAGTGGIVIGGDGIPGAELITAAEVLLTNTATHSIEGSGLLLDGRGRLNNQGFVEANDPDWPLEIRPGNPVMLPSGVLASMANSGFLLAAEGGTLLLNTTLIDNTDGTISAAEQSAIRFRDVEITGGRLIVEPGGEALVEQGRLMAVTDVQIAGKMFVQADGSVRFRGTNTLEGALVGVGEQGPASVTLADGARLIGAGSVSFAGVGSTLFVGEPTVRGGPTPRATIGAGVTVRGSGLLMDGSGDLRNEGRLVGDSLDGSLIVRPFGTVENVGQIVAESRNPLRLVDAHVLQDPDAGPDGDIAVLGPLSRLSLEGSIIEGGTVRGDGLLTIVGVTETRQTLAPPSGARNTVFDVEVQQAGGSVMTLEGTVQVLQPWNLEGDLPSEIAFGDGSVLTGSGRFRSVPLPHLVSTSPNSLFTIESDIVMELSGRMLDGAGGFKNFGTIRGIAADPALIITPQDTLSVTNVGLLESGPTGRVVLDRGVFDNDGGEIIANPGGTIEIANGATVVGGLLQSQQQTNTRTNGNPLIGDVLVKSGTTLRGVTTRGLIRVTPEESGDQFFIGGTFNNSGSIRIESQDRESTIWFEGGTQIVGNGGITSLGFITRQPGSRILAPITPTVKVLPSPVLDPEEADLLIGPGQTVRGGIQFFEGNSGLTNRGFLNANQQSDFIVMPNSIGFTNEGTIQVEANSAFRVVGPSGAFNNMDAAPGRLTGGEYTIRGTFQTPDPIAHVGTGTRLTLQGSAVVLEDGAGSDTTAELRSVLAGGHLIVRDGMTLNSGFGFNNSGTIEVLDATLSASLIVQVQAGAVLRLAAGVLDTPQVLVSAGTLSGSGLVANQLSVNMAGTLSPGEGMGGIGSIAAGSLSLGSGATFVVDVQNTSTFDRVPVAGAVMVGGTLQVRFASTPAVGSEYLIIPTNGPVSGSFATVTVNPPLPEGLSLRVRTRPDGLAIRVSGVGEGFTVR